MNVRTNPTVPLVAEAMGGLLRMSRPGHRDALVPLGPALEALGEDGMTGQWHGDVPVSGIVGTESAPRAQDFDARFRPRNKGLADRLRQVEGAVRSGKHLQPVDLVLLGEMFFVRDGHHRVSVARALGWETIPARVQQICTVAFAMACLRTAHLCSKAAERRFLARVPLPDDVRRDLWLDEPASWVRLADAAEAWGFRRSLEGRLLTDRRAFATAWWSEEVSPVVDRLRTGGADPDIRDVQLYVGSLVGRDRAAQLSPLRSL